MISICQSRAFQQRSDDGKLEGVKQKKKKGDAAFNVHDVSRATALYKSAIWSIKNYKSYDKIRESMKCCLHKRLKLAKLEQSLVHPEQKQAENVSDKWGIW